MLVKLLKTLLCLKIFLIFISCSSSQNSDNPLFDFKEKAVELSPTVINTDKPILLGGRIAMFTDSILAIATPKEDSLLALIHIPKKKIWKRMFPRGKGPGEATALGFCSQANKDQLLLNAPNQRVVYNLDMEAIMTKKTHEIEPFLKLATLDMIKIDSFFISSGVYVEDNRFRIFDLHGNPLASCLHYEKLDEFQNIPDHLYSTGYFGSYTVHPDNKKFAFALFYGGRIQYFDFTPGSVSLNTDLLFFHPSLRFENVLIMQKNSKCGFLGIDSNENFVYLLYSGKLMEDYIQDSSCHHLLVYDWSGNPIKHYELELPLSTFCLNAAGDKIYGIAFNPETTIVQYDLK